MASIKDNTNWILARWTTVVSRIPKYESFNVKCHENGELIGVAQETFIFYLRMPLKWVKLQWCGTNIDYISQK